MKANLVFGAHPDDEILGPGGTIASLSQQGEKVESILFTRGNRFPPWWDEKKLEKTREKESKNAAKILGISKTHFLGFRDAEIIKQVNDAIIEKIVKIIRKEEPERIFYHSKNDTHPDHVAVSTIVERALEKINPKPKCYSYEISNFVNFFERKDPKIFFDVTNTLDEKIAAIRAFQSQKLLMLPLIPIVFARAVSNGRKSGFRYAEKFTVTSF